MKNFGVWRQDMFNLNRKYLSYFAIILFFPSAAFAEKGNTHGQIGGSFDLKIDSNKIARIGYFVQDSEQINIIKKWTGEKNNILYVSRSLSIYDLFIIVVNNKAVVNGLINSKHTGLFTENQVQALNKSIDDFAIYKGNCMLVPIAVSDVKLGRANVLQFFVYDGDLNGEIPIDDIDACLSAGFALAK